VIARPWRRTIDLYGPALAPFLPLVCLIAILAAVALLSPSNPPALAARHLVVAGTDGAGVFLRNSPTPTDWKQVLPEGTQVVEVAPSPDRAWRQVLVLPSGPAGWVPAQYVRVAP
jgi:hypothetical protein